MAKATPLPTETIEEIHSLRRAGFGWEKIAKEVGRSVNKVRCAVDEEYAGRHRRHVRNSERGLTKTKDKAPGRSTTEQRSRKLSPDERKAQRERKRKKRERRKRKQWEAERQRRREEANAKLRTPERLALIEKCRQEARETLDQLKADGVTLYSYGYMSDQQFFHSVVPTWVRAAELSQQKGKPYKVVIEVQDGDYVRVSDFKVARGSTNEIVQTDDDVIQVPDKGNEGEVIEGD